MNEEYNNFENNEEVSKEAEVQNEFQDEANSYSEDIIEIEIEDEDIYNYEHADENEPAEEPQPEPEKVKKEIKPMYVIVASLVMAVLIAGTFFAFGFKGKTNVAQEGDGIKYYSSESKPTDAVNTSNAQIAPSGAELTTAEIAAKVGPSVVGIEGKSKSINIFRQSSSATQSGSGVIVNEDGYIVTNYHVIEGSDELKVILNSGKEYQAEVIGFDERSDLAVIKINEKNLNYATFGDSSQLMVGERVVAIGNPLGTELMGTVTQGIISAVNRTVQVQDKTLTLLQTDAAINSGNSGGALINSRGEVIGINTVKMYATGVEGIGFAIPSNEVKSVLNDIMTYGYVKGRLVIGVTGTNVTEKMSSYYELPVGFYVSEVREGYGAYLAGVKVGDVIIKCDGQVVKTIDDINKIRDTHKVNEFMEIVVSRNGKNVTLNVKLMEERPEE